MMTNEEIATEIKEVMELNRQARRRSNDILTKAMNRLGKKDEEAYERGMNDIWEAIIYFQSLSYGQRNKYFGLNDNTNGLADVISILSPQEFIGKYEETKKKNEEEDKEFHVGDEVRWFNGTTFTYGVITRLLTLDRVYILWKDGSCGENPVSGLEKTGVKRMNIELHKKED